MSKKKNVEEKEHTRSHIGLKRSLLQSVIVLIVGIVKALDLQMIRSSQKAINCDLWDRGMVTYDNSFCYRADPRK